eukprot:s1312_g9.t3
MVLGRKKPGPAPTSEVGDQLLEDGEKLLAEQRYGEAYECFQGAVSHLPTKQLAWYNLGFAASELWQAEAGDEFLPSALEAFRMVLRLDTSKRAELRYLSALALGRLLTRQAEGLEGEEAAPVPPVQEALQHFGEAWRLVQEWGAPDLGADWGDWGKAQALEMKRRIESIEGLGPGLQQVNWQEQLEVLSKLCEEAAEKFTRAQTAIDDEGDDEGNDGMEERDVDWMVLHVEHLLEFVNFAKVALNNCQSLETKTEWLRRALLAWRSALTEILAICYLAPGYDALKGDTFAAACRLLLASPETVSALRSMSLGQLFGAEGLLLPELPRHGANGELVDPLPPTVTEEQLAALAEAAYVAAGAALPLGELQLDLGRMAVARRLDPKPHLQKASEAFQAAGKKRDDKAIAWYNLACVAGLAGRPDAAARALKMCLEALPKPSEKVSWMQEALQDVDLQPVMNSPDMQDVKALLPQKKEKPKKTLGGYAPKRMCGSSLGLSIGQSRRRCLWVQCWKSYPNSGKGKEVLPSDRGPGWVRNPLK